jgi:hypothetical protein
MAAFIACKANIYDAAKKLRVPSSDLRRLVLSSQELMAAMFELEEIRLDKAERILERELAPDDPRYSAAAAYFVLRNAKRAVSRGWRQPDVEVQVDSSGPPIRAIIRWGDGTKIAEVDFPSDTVFPQRPLIEHEDPARARRGKDEEPACEREDHPQADNPAE